MPERNTLIGKDSGVTLGFAAVIVTLILGAVMQYAQTRTSQQHIKATVLENKDTLRDMNQDITEILIRRETFTTIGDLATVQARVLVLEKTVGDLEAKAD